MTARLMISLGLATIMMSTVACNRSKDTPEASAKPTTVLAEEKAGPDCSGLMGNWSLVKPIKANSELKEIFFFEKDGVMTMKLSADSNVATVFPDLVVDGQEHEVAGNGVVNSSCDKDGLLVVDFQDNDHKRSVSTSAPVIRFTIAERGEFAGHVLIQSVTITDEGKEKKAYVGSSEILRVNDLSAQVQPE